MPLAFTTSVALAAFYLGDCRRREGRGAWAWLLAGYVAVGLGVLLKGPIAGGLPGGVLAVGIFRRRQPYPPFPPFLRGGRGGMGAAAGLETGPRWGPGPGPWGG